MAGAAELEAEQPEAQDGNVSIPSPVKLFDNLNLTKSD